MRNVEMDMVAINEMYVYITNNGNIYEHVKYATNNLAKKVIKETYNHELSLKLWYNIAVKGLKVYAKDFGGHYSNYLTVAERNELAKMLRNEYAQLLHDTVHEMRKAKKFRVYGKPIGKKQFVKMDMVFNGLELSKYERLVEKLNNTDNDAIFEIREVRK